MNPKYPHIVVPLSELDSNVFVIIGETDRALRKAKVPLKERSAFIEGAISGDYDNAVNWIKHYVATT